MRGGRAISQIVGRLCQTPTLMHWRFTETPYKIPLQQFGDLNGVRRCPDVAASLCRGVRQRNSFARRQSAVATTDRDAPPLQQFGDLNGVQCSALEQLIA